MRALFSIVLALIPIALSAQNAAWRERIDSSYVEAQRARTELSALPIHASDMRRTASPLGEADPIKFIQTIPGVSPGMEGSSAYFVRGGNSGNNITTLDGVPVYGAGHLLGLTTSYPADIVAHNEFFSGGFPSDADGFTSSLLQLTTKGGDFRKSETSVSINNFLAGVQYSTPVKEGKSSILALLRVSPLGLEYNALHSLMDADLPVPDRINSLVGDAYLKWSWISDNWDRFFVSLFGSHDGYGYKTDDEASRSMGWNNLIANFSWNRETTSGWALEGRISYNHFDAFQSQDNGQAISTRLSMRSGLDEEGIHFKASRSLDDLLTVQTGSDIFLTFFSPGVSKVFKDNKHSATSSNPLTTARGSINGQLDYSRNSFHASAGLKGTLFLTDGYTTFMPCADLSAIYELSQNLRLKATYDHSVQFFHTLEGIPCGWSLEMHVPSTRKNKPESADQLWAGVEYSHKAFSFSAGIFDKWMKDLVLYSDASSFFSSGWKEWQSNLESGKGHSYGVELMSTVDTKQFAGHISYTLSKTDRTFPSVNFGNPIPFKFDRRHMLNISGEYKLSGGGKASHSITAGLSYMSGHWETVKSGSYTIYSLGTEKQRESRTADYTSHPDNFQLPSYFRVDAGYHISWGGAHNSYSLSLGVYNLTNHHNVYSLSWDNESQQWKQLSIFPIMPNFTFKVTFGRR